MQDTYPDDELFQQWTNHYTQTGRAGLEEMIHPPTTGPETAVS